MSHPKRHLPTKRENLEKYIWSEMAKLRESFKARDSLLVTDDNFAVGDLLASNLGRSIHRVEKRTPKTVTLSTAYSPPDKAGTCLAKDFVWTNEKRYMSASFDLEFKKTSEKEIDRVTQLTNRLKFIREFCR